MLDGEATWGEKSASWFTVWGLMVLHGQKALQQEWGWGWAGSRSPGGLIALCLYHEAKNKQEVELDNKTSMPAPQSPASCREALLPESSRTFPNSTSSWGGNVPTHRLVGDISHFSGDIQDDLRLKQHCIVEIAHYIHIASDSGSHVCGQLYHQGKTQRPVFFALQKLHCQLP